MHIDDLRLLYDYNYWANSRLLKTADLLTDEEFTHATELGSVRDTLVHILNGEWYWRSRVQGEKPSISLEGIDFPTRAALRARWHEEEQVMRLFLQDLREDDLHQPVWKTIPLLSVLLHIVNHGTQHRSEAAMMLTGLGRSPGELDFLRFVLKQQRSQPRDH